MSNYCTFHRLPRAGVDRIDSPEVALAMIGFMMGDPMRSETLVLLLDEQHRGIQVTVVSGTVARSTPSSTSSSSSRRPRSPLTSISTLSSSPPSDRRSGGFPIPTTATSTDGSRRTRCSTTPASIYWNGS